MTYLINFFKPSIFVTVQNRLTEYIYPCRDIYIWTVRRILANLDGKDGKNGR